MFENLPIDAGISRSPATFSPPPEAGAQDDDYLSRLVDMGDPPASAYDDWEYLSAQESHELEAELVAPVTTGSIAGAWLLSAADPSRVNWQRNKWWGPDDAHLH